MENRTHLLLQALDLELARTAATQKLTVDQAKAAIGLTRKAMKLLNRVMPANDFQKREDEIRFFKEIRPQFYSRYIYYVNVYQYLVQLPPGGESVLHAYIALHLTDIERFFDRNKAFYQYFRSGATQMDEIYYTHKGLDGSAEPEAFEEHELNGSSPGYKLSRLLANEKFQDFLKSEASRIGQEETSALGKVFPFRHPQWTASQTDLVELIYSLKTGCAVNHGNIDIAELTSVFAFVFGIELNETYHKLLDITRRKKEMFVFLTRLRTSLGNFISDKFAVLLLIIWCLWK
ncbi:MAG TPA: RteC domain-containing protein [Mucilaginibacter sp.]